MADAFLIETGGDTAGIAVIEGAGFRFFASAATFYSLDGLIFETIGEVHSAVRHLRNGKTATTDKVMRLKPAA